MLTTNVYIIFNSINTIIYSFFFSFTKYSDGNYFYYMYKSHTISRRASLLFKNNNEITKYST